MLFTAAVKEPDAVFPNLHDLNACLVVEVVKCFPVVLHNALIVRPRRITDQLGALFQNGDPVSQLRQMHGCIYANLIPADHHHILGQFRLMAEYIIGDPYMGQIGAGDIRSCVLGTYCDHDAVVSLTLQISEGHSPTKADRDLETAEFPDQIVLVVPQRPLKADEVRMQKLSSEHIFLLKQRHVMSALFCYDRCVHSGRTAADHSDFFGGYVPGDHFFKLVLEPEQGIDGANAPVHIGGIAGVALVAADAWNNILAVPAFEFAPVFRIADPCTARLNDIQLVFTKCLFAPVRVLVSA